MRRGSSPADSEVMDECRSQNPIGDCAIAEIFARDTVWTPGGVTIMLAIEILLHLEDG